MSSARVTCLLALSLAALPLQSRAKTYELPDANPAAVVYLPNSWKPSEVEKGVEALRQGGADVTVRRDPTGTHFLLFARPDEVFGLIAEWVRK